MKLHLLIILLSITLSGNKFTFKSVDKRMKAGDKEWTEWEYTNEDVKIEDLGNGFFLITQFFDKYSWRKEKVQYVKEAREGGFQYKSIKTTFDSEERLSYAKYDAIISATPLSKMSNGINGKLTFISNSWNTIYETDCRK